jgi:serine/threonine-protein kinase
MATVYLCLDTKFGRKVAIKLLHPDLAAAVGAERFHREIRIATGLTHPNILPAYDSGEADGSLYYVMPFVEGESLRDRITRERQLPVQDAVRITVEVAGALQYAHTHGIVHRDIKPENVLLESDHAVLADFGIARAITSDVEALTQTGMSLGTPAYMSPEQALGEKTLDGRSDQYALACVTYEMLTGGPPFMANTMQALVAKHLGEPVPLITTVRPAVPDELEDVVLRALEKVPADRFQTMQEFSDSLNGVIATTGTWARRTHGLTPARTGTRGYRTAAPPLPAPRRARWIEIGLGAGLVLLGAVLAISRWGHRSGDAPNAQLNAVVVAYFADNSRTGSLGPLADGLTESITEQLSRIDALDVRSRNAVWPYRSLPSDSVGHLLQANYVVRGAVDSTSRGVKLDVFLDDASSGANLQRKSFWFGSNNLLAMQDSVAAEVADWLRPRIGDDVKVRENRLGTQSQTAWLLLQQGERLRKDADSVLTAGAPDIALKSLSQADSVLVLAEAADRKWSAPSALRAAVWYAKAQALRKDPARLGAAVDSGIAHADSALIIDPRNADALEYKGKFLFNFRVTEHLVVDPKEVDRTLVEAESTLVRATRFNPDQAGAWDALSALYYRKPDLQAVEFAASRAYRADAYLRSARTILQRLFLAQYNLEHFPEAMNWLNLFRQRFPNDRFYYDGRLLMYRARFGKPDIDSAWTYAAKELEMAPETERPFSRKRLDMYVAGVIANAGRGDSARQVLLRARDASGTLDPKRDLAAIEAAVRVMLGDQDEAVRLLKEYLSVNPEHRKGFAARTGWWWRDLQSNPKFKALIGAER